MTYGALRQQNAALALGALLATAGGPASATIAISGSLNAESNTRVYPFLDPQISLDSASWAGTPASLAVSAEAASVAGPGVQIRAYDSAQASWESADRGAINFGPSGWEFTNPGMTTSAMASVRPSFPDGSWTYVFTAESNGVFQMEYSMARFGFLFGLDGYNLRWEQQRGGDWINDDHEHLGDWSLANESGVVRRSVVAGGTYRVGLVNDGNLVINGTVAGWKTASFAWSISAVPEPGTWVLAIAGFIAVGTGLRRRRALDKLSVVA